MEPNFGSSIQQLVAALSNPKDSYEFVSRHGKDRQILPYLLQILIDPSYQLEQELRIQAAIMIRNAIDSWYRKISPHQLEPQEKTNLGYRLVDDILAKGESDTIVRKQVSLCVGKIGKWNFDSKLSNLFESLMLHIGSSFSKESSPSNFLTLIGCLGAVYQIIQNMISNRSMRGQMLLREVARNHFMPIYNLYASVLSTWTTAMGQQKSLNLSSLFHSQNSIELSRICLKILGQLATYAWKDPHGEQLVTTFLRQSVDQLVHVLTMRKHIVEMVQLHRNVISKGPAAASIESFFALFNKHVFKYGKIFINIFEQDPELLNNVELRECLAQTIWQIIEEGSKNPESEYESLPRYLVQLPERLLIQSLRIMTQVTNIQSPSSAISADQAIELSRIIITRLLPLRKHSLEFWAEDAESYDNEEIALMENVSFDVRSASASLLSCLLMIYPQELVGVILQLYSQFQSLDSSALKSLLQMEAIHLAIGLSTTKLLQYPDSTCTFYNWIKDRFMPLICLTDSDGRVLRRRIGWVLGEFSKEEVDLETQNSIYFALNCLLENPNNDVATKLATCRSLKLTANWDHFPGSDQPMLVFLGSYIGHISILFTLVENLDSQKVLTETMGLVIQKAGTNIRPYSNQLMSTMTNLWQQVSESPSKSNSATHLHNAILVTMTTLVEALGSDSHSYHDLICVIIEHSTNPANPSSIYLQEDGFILWLTILRQATALTPQLASMIPRLLDLARAANESLGILLRILQSYILLDAPLVLNTCGPALAVTLSELLTISAALPPIKGILMTMTYLVKCCCAAQWKCWFVSSDCFEKLIQASVAKDQSTSSTVKHILTVCQLITTDIQAFYDLLAHSAAQLKGVSAPAMLMSFCQACLDKIDNIGEAQNRKLLASALAVLCSQSNPVVISHLDSFVSTWSSVLAEGDEIFEESTRTYHYTYEQKEQDEFEYVQLGEEEIRLLKLCATDPVKSQTLSQIISQQIELGGQELTSALSQVDPLLVDDLRQRLSGLLKG
ncbi:hypothetical protein CROQUDRAFT_73922 [Cronartium quercuum f. sp. fusiforme G11]|uniref:Importin-7/11-like TPR repeats domain-containing protein n=1 Tax=Cronartium quercuum f. sp. fusiforme G11 TaxID=708437 RepID=A0A9P6NMB7_9BASI|nr:hypothetical protein CROQUDRAFT_73922 [Cronartium quercuum f. sp. fusiforme G11]